jgi:hypothetical protein
MISNFLKKINISLPGDQVTSLKQVIEIHKMLLEFIDWSLHCQV